MYSFNCPRELDYSWLESVPNSSSQLRMSSATSGHHNCGFPINKLHEATSQTSQTHQSLDQHIGWRRKNVGWDEILWSQLLNRSSHSVSNPEVCIPSCKRDLEWVVQGWDDSAMKSSRNQVPLSFVFILTLVLPPVFPPSLSDCTQLSYNSIHVFLKIYQVM